MLVFGSGFWFWFLILVFQFLVFDFLALTLLSEASPSFIIGVLSGGPPFKQVYILLQLIITLDTSNPTIEYAL